MFHPPIYYFVGRIFVRKKEDFLIEKFGEELIKFKKQINAFSAKLKKYKPEK